MTAPIHARLADPTLQARIRRIAGGDEDLVQHLHLALVERAAADPTFAEQQVGYLIKFVAWSARHYAERAHVYDRYVAPEPLVRDDDGDLVSAFDEAWPAAGMTPEQALEVKETLAGLASQIDGLPVKQGHVARLLAGGHRPSEIASLLAMSRSAVSHLAGRMRLALSL